jgi:uncharacterized protein YegP (UPF0339 family)
MRFQIFNDSRGGYSWRLKAANGLIIANGESYTAKANCEAAIALVKAARLEQFTVYVDARNEWRWRLKATNGEIIAQSSESYRNRSDCENAARIVYGVNSATPVDDLTVATVRR